MKPQNECSGRHKRCYESPVPDCTEAKHHCIETSPESKHKHAESQRKYMAKLKTPEKSKDLIAYKQKKKCKIERTLQN